ncbi:B-cell receptor CD22-like [Engraulis encrasicolus]|uniref:B-cell receptor CD22-like n=1 Tax=Engraulis encrasicolus TaxID=184585 RepID=UPI002FCF0551
MAVLCEWSVSHSSTHICGLKGAAVVLPCTYDYPWKLRGDTYRRGEWYRGSESGDVVREHSNTMYPNCSLKIDKLSEEHEHSITSSSWFYKKNGSSNPNKIYQNRTAYLRNTIHSCSVKLKDIRESHSGEYWFRFVTGPGQGYSGLPGVKISVTGGDVSFVWFRNSVFFNHTGDKNLHFNPVRAQDSGNYSCAVGGQETLSSTAVILNIRYLPKCSSIFLSHADAEVAEGVLVTLTCICDANPAVRNYTWHFRTTTLTKVIDTAGQSLSFNMTPDLSGHYYCEAENAVGSQSSAEVAVLLEGNDAT